MDSLSKNMTYELALKVDANDLKSYYDAISSDKEKGNWYHDNSFWAKIAKRDFGFPEGVFAFTGQRFMKPHLRYDYIKNIVPNQESMKTLNEIAVHWHPTNQWQEKESEEIVPEKFKDLEDYLNWIESISEDSFFEFDSIYVKHVYTLSTSKERNKFTKMTLFRSNYGDSVTYMNILECARIVCPTDYSSIEKFEYIGFSDDGVPILEVTMNF